MNRPDVSTLVGVSLLAVAAVSSSMFLAGEFGTQARDGSAVGVGAGTSASIATVGTPHAAVQAAVTTVVGVARSQSLPPTTVTPTPYALYEAIVESFPQSRIAEAIAVTKCETGGTWRADVVSPDGAEGSFQVLARYHGAVPADYAGQAQQAAAIVNKTGGWALWSCQP